MNLDYSTQKGNFKLLWGIFKNAFVNAAKQVDVYEPWTSDSKRTKLYFEKVLPNIAEKIGLNYAPEMKFRVDCTFYVESSQGAVRVPIIQIESENNAKSSDDEIYKLCALNVPLKVLIVCHEWNEKSKKELTEGYWNYIIESFAEESNLSGYLAIIIAEMNQTLKFHSYVYDENGVSISEEDRVMIEISYPSLK